MQAEVATGKQEPAQLLTVVRLAGHIGGPSTPSPMVSPASAQFWDSPGQEAEKENQNPLKKKSGLFLSLRDQEF